MRVNTVHAVTYGLFGPTGRAEASLSVGCDRHLMGLFLLKLCRNQRLNQILSCTAKLALWGLNMQMSRFNSLFFYAQDITGLAILSR